MHEVHRMIIRSLGTTKRQKVKELKDSLPIDISTYELNRELSKLEREGLVIKEKSPHYERLNVWSLSPEGLLCYPT